MRKDRNPPFRQDARRTPVGERRGSPIGLMLLIPVLLAAVFGASYFVLEGNLERQTGYVFGFSISTMNNPYCAYLESTLRSMAEADGNRLIALDPQYNQQKQMEQIKALLEQEVDLLFLCPVNYREVAPALLECRARKVPIVNFDCEIAQEEYVDCIVNSDNYSAGMKCAQDIQERFPDGAKIAIIDDQKAVSVVDRMEGFLDGMRDTASEVVIRVDSDGSLEAAMPIAMDFLRARRDVQVIMCANDSVASGVVAAIEVLGLEDQGILVYGIDGSPEAKALIRDGKMTATIAQSPIQTAKICYEQAIKLLSGDEVTKRILVDVYKIDATNLQNYNVSGWQ